MAFWRKKKDSEDQKPKPESVEVPEPEISPVDPLTEKIAYRRLWKVGLAAAILATVMNLFVYGVATALGIPLVIPADSDSGTMVQLPIASIVTVSFLAAVGATLLLAFFGLPFFQNRLPRPTRILWGTAFFVLLFSLVGPLSLPVEDKTKYVLSLMHLVTAIFIVSVLTLFGRQK